MTLYAIGRLLLLGFVAGAGVSVAADESPPPVAGARVRLTAPSFSGKRLIGTVAAVDEATLTLRLQDAKSTVKVPRTAISKFEVSRVGSRKGKGAMIGALLGLGVAVAMGLGLGEDCDSRPEVVQYGVPFLGSPGGVNRRACMGKGETAVLASFLFVPPAALIGLAVAPGEKWVETTPDRVRLAVTPVPGTGIGAAVSIRF